jgi:hypothetical protein
VVNFVLKYLWRCWGIRATAPGFKREATIIMLLGGACGKAQGCWGGKQELTVMLSCWWLREQALCRRSGNVVVRRAGVDNATRGGVDDERRPQRATEVQKS